MSGPAVRAATCARGWASAAVEQVAQAAERGAAFGQHAPAADDLLHRRQRAAEQDGGGDHDAGRRLAADDELGAERQHQHLHRLPHGARQRRHADRLAAPSAAAAPWPRRSSGASARAARRSCRASARPRRSASRPRDSAPRRRDDFITASMSRRVSEVVEHRQRQHQQRRARRRHAEHRMREPDDADVDHHPRRVEQREQAPATKTARAAPPRRAALRTAVGRCAARPARPRCARPPATAPPPRRCPPRPAGGCAGSRARASAPARCRRRATAPAACRRSARQHAVEDLQHEDRGDQQQQVDEEGEARDVEQRALEELKQLGHRKGRVGGCERQATAAPPHARGTSSRSPRRCAGPPRAG